MLCANEKITEIIVSLLRTKGLRGKEIREKLSNRGIKISSQATYDALNKLVKEEVVLKKGMVFNLNYVWLKRLNQFSRLPDVRSTLLNLEEMRDGDKDTYEFTNLNRAGAFWMHVHQILLDTLKTGQIAVLYSPNEWTSIIRAKEDLEWAKTASESDKVTLFAIGHSNNHNQKYQRQQTSNNLNISVGNTFRFPPGYYLNVFNDYVVELILPEKFAQALNDIFQKTKDDSELSAALSDIGPSKIKLTIKRNSILAKKLSKRIVKDFYLSKSSTSNRGMKKIVL